MNPKMQLRVSFDPEVVREARELGLNISAVCERALKRRIEVLRALEVKDEE